MDGLLRDPIPPETRSTCEDCAMCAPSGMAADPKTLYFSPRVKCCSYQPKLPNFLVGRILEDPDFSFSAGKTTLERRIDAGIGVSPLGLDQTPTYSLLYKHGLAGFGRAESLRCPHYLDEGGGRCGIWRHRNGVCATWFCKHERGGVGLDFWSCLRDLLMIVERDLAAWCVTESSLGTDAIAAIFLTRRKPNEREAMTLAEVEGVPDLNAARQLWGDWFGRERDFFVECGRRVGPLNWKEVERIASPEVGARSRILRKAFTALTSQELPERVMVSSFQTVSSSREGVQVVGYSGSDPLEMTPEVMQILPYFDGRPLEQILRTLREELRVEVEKDLVKKLLDFEILASAPDL
jgi:hypothetical protein